MTETANGASVLPITVEFTYRCFRLEIAQSEF